MDRALCAMMYYVAGCLKRCGQELPDGGEGRIDRTEGDHESEKAKKD